MAAPPPAAEESDAGQALAALRACGADRLDPVRFRYLEALAQRSAAHHGDVRQLLERKLAQGLASCRARHEAAAALHAAPPPAQGGDKGGPLAQLVRQLNAHAPAAAELKALSQFRSTWARLSVDRQLSRSLARPPENAGPLNSHQLVLRALQQMQDIAPAYLEGFVAKVETLLWLDRASLGRMSAPAAAPRREAGDKPDKPLEPHKPRKPRKPSKPPKPARGGPSAAA